MATIVADKILFCHVSMLSGKMTITRINTFFENGFGRNDFRPVNEKEITHGNTINYLLKYISKSGEKIVYSRGDTFGGVYKDKG